MTWLDQSISEKWRNEGKRYAKEVNEFVRRGMAGGWAETDDNQEPRADRRSQLAAKVLRMIQEANAAGEVELLRQELPAASWPLTSEFEQQLQSVRPMVQLEDGRVILGVGQPWSGYKMYIATIEEISELEQVSFTGVSPDGRYIAFVDKHSIRVIQGRDITGAVVRTYIWTEILSQIRAETEGVQTLADEASPELQLIEVIPFGEEHRVLLVTMHGVYLVKHGQVELVEPDLPSLRKHELEETRIDMGHGSVSPDGQWIACGSQGSDHVLMHVESGTRYEIPPEISYPHYSIFTRDGKQVWYNACHFYNGATVSVNVPEKAGAETALEQQEWPFVDESMRVYAGAALKEGIILGDAYGYLRLLDENGQEKWRYFVGSTIAGLLVSPDESQLYVGTYGGMLHVLDLQSVTTTDYDIGTAPLRENGRWMLWKECEPLRW